MGGGGETRVQSTLDIIIKSSLRFSKGGESNQVLSYYI